MYSIRADLSTNRATLRKLKLNGANQEAFEFEPDQVGKLGPTWKTEDFELE